MIKIQECYEIEDGEEYEIIHRYLSGEDVLRFADWCKFYKDRGQEIIEIKRDFNKLRIFFGGADFISFDVHPRIIGW